MDIDATELIETLTKGIITLTGLPFEHNIGKDALSSTIYLHLGRTCVGSLYYTEHLLIFTLFRPADPNLKVGEKTFKYDYANPDSLDPEKVAKMIRESVDLLVRDGLITKEQLAPPPASDIPQGRTDG